MTRKEKQRLEYLAQTFKALSHPARLWIVEFILDGERCVHELVEGLDLNFSTVSQHLSVLKQAGIIEDDKRGKNVYYRIKADCMKTLIGCLEEGIRKSRYEDGIT
ncbi:MAG: metalloregulator ArsR/SmtB family transcription factor [Candidatus Marinimicrobia bacterium]|nr:metalloregulator ArsR/SmtB family transcription factor [Candidatus Neomarinimicrobiota bacterium]MDD4960747.1 metalloregulator ArsR/SmtB family transcription factor [Candidatus Neomarinimicrobiota bacterium]MDD5708910.1 metalloregulator ArsR/SmtB family transcription factor [Candidatus Neomarinimicrobiota bacterium]MDX9777768.1 metalloregulator ArsR/SmtB family transcription factor [bacterium]